MSDHHDARILELEKQVEELRALLDKEAARVEDHRIEQLRTEHDQKNSIELLKGQFCELRTSLDKDSARIDAHRKDSRESASLQLDCIQILEKNLFELDENTAELQIKNKEVMMGLAQSIIEQDDRVRRMFMRLNDVYYHTFPDRLEQDAELSEQMTALGLTPSVDVVPKKEWEAYISKASRDANPDKE